MHDRVFGTADRPARSALQVGDQGGLLGLHGGAGRRNVGGAPRHRLDLDQVAKEISRGAMERVGAEGAADALAKLLGHYTGRAQPVQITVQRCLGR